MKQYNNASEGATVVVLGEAPTVSKSPVVIQRADDHLREAAASHVRNGFKVFPLAPNGKVPAFKDQDWRLLATSDPDRAHRFWSEALSGDPLDFNIGIVTGGGLFVLDVDNKDGKNGSATLARLEREHGDLAPTLVIRTPSGGFHYYYRAPPGVWIANGASKLGDGLDIRGDGGYVVGPGSVIDGLMYEPEPQR